MAVGAWVMGFVNICNADAGGLLFCDHVALETAVFVVANIKMHELEDETLAEEAAARRRRVSWLVEQVDDLIRWLRQVPDGAALFGEAPQVRHLREVLLALDDEVWLSGR
jgi:hypothetical protein